MCCCPVFRSHLVPATGSTHPKDILDATSLTWRYGSLWKAMALICVSVRKPGESSQPVPGLHTDSSYRGPVQVRASCKHLAVSSWPGTLYFSSLALQFVACLCVCHTGIAREEEVVILHQPQKRGATCCPLQTRPNHPAAPVSSLRRFPLQRKGTGR